MMSRMIIMRGLPGSGKSTLARDIESKMLSEYHYNDAPEPIVLSTDDYFMVGGHYAWEASLVGAGHNWNQRRVAVACNLGWNVIVDNTNCTFQEMRPYLQIANDFEYNVVLAVPNTEWAFSTVSCCDRGKHDVPYKTIYRMHGRFENNDTVIEKAKKAFPELVVTSYQHTKEQ